MAAATLATAEVLPPARVLPAVRDDVRLLVVAPGAFRGRRIFATRTSLLPALLHAGDLLVVNDAATLPAALAGHDQQGRAIEARLCHHEGDSRFHAVLFGAGDWRVRTEERPAPPLQVPGARLRFGQLEATVRSTSALSPRLVGLEFHARGDALWAAIYREGRPIQYSHLQQPLPLWAVENVYAGRPWAFEMPSAGRPLSWGLLARVRARGVGIVSLTHAAGLSATGDPALDAALPFPERYEIPAATVAAVSAARAQGGRVIAVGTSVVRALEGAYAANGRLRAGTGITDLRLHPGHVRRVVDGLLCGVHDPHESHYALLGAFAEETLLRAAHRFALAQGFHSHELGDVALVLPQKRAVPGGSPSITRPPMT
jgi:S-adenosylmethionine:tRNA ribosyltransferase-isomerase